MKQVQVAQSWHRRDASIPSHFEFLSVVSTSVGILAPLILFIASVSVHDAVLLIQNQEVIGEFEQNPIGRWLLTLGNDKVWLFVCVKLLGTAVVCTSLIGISEYSRRLGYITTAGLAAFQAGLLYYLCTY
jgi:hypothetical protein